MTAPCGGADGHLCERRWHHPRSRRRRREPARSAQPRHVAAAQHISVWRQPGGRRSGSGLLRARAAAGPGDGRAPAKDRRRRGAKQCAVRRAIRRPVRCLARHAAGHAATAAATAAAHDGQHGPQDAGARLKRSYVTLFVVLNATLRPTWTGGRPGSGVAACVRAATQALELPMTCLALAGAPQPADAAGAGAIHAAACAAAGPHATGLSPAAIVAAALPRRGACAAGSNNLASGQPGRERQLCGEAPLQLMTGQACSPARPAERRSVEHASLLFKDGLCCQNWRR